MAMKKLAQVNLLFVLERNTEAVAQRCPIKKVFPEISQNSQKNTCTRVSLLKKSEFCKISSSALSYRTPPEIKQNTFLEIKNEVKCLHYPTKGNDCINI